MKDILTLTKKIIEFRNARNWKQFHNPKDMALSLMLEAAEVLEHFQWKNEEEFSEYLENNKEKIGHELADVLYWVLLISHDLGVNLEEAFVKKMEVNETKYPVKESINSSKKYTAL